jgi:hypothetical protein
MCKSRRLIHNTLKQKNKDIVMATRLTSKKIANTYFGRSGYMKPGIDVWKTLDFDSKVRFRAFIIRAEKRIGAGSPEERLTQVLALIPPFIAANVAKVYANDPERKQYIAAPPVAEQKQLAIEDKQPPVKGASEASLSSSSSVAVLPLARDPEDGGIEARAKRPRAPESFSALQGANNVPIEKVPKRQSVRTGVAAPSFGQVVPFVEEAPDEAENQVLDYSPGFKEITRQAKAARERADPEFKVQADAPAADESGQLVLYKDDKPPKRVNKDTFAKDQGLSERQKRATAVRHEKRMANASANRQPADYVRDLVSGGILGSSMFGSAAEIVGGSASAGTGIGAALLGGGSGSVLDRMIASNSSESTLALVNTIGKMIVVSGAGAQDNRLLKAIGSLIPRASEAISLIQNPALFPQVAYEHLAKTGVLSRLSQKAEDFGQSLLDKVAGRSPPVMRGIGALPPLVRSPVLTITEADGRIIQHSQDAVMNRELQGRPLLDPSTDNTERPQSAMEVAATNMVQAGVTGTPTESRRVYWEPGSAGGDWTD